MTAAIDGIGLVGISEPEIRAGGHGEAAQWWREPGGPAITTPNP